MAIFWIATSWWGEGSNAECGDQKAEARFTQYQMYPWRGLDMAEGD